MWLIANLDMYDVADCPLIFYLNFNKHYLCLDLFLNADNRA